MVFSTAMQKCVVWFIDFARHNSAARTSTKTGLQVPLLSIADDDRPLWQKYQPRITVPSGVASLIISTGGQ